MAKAPIRKGRWAIKEQAGWGTAETTFAATDVIECAIQLPVTPAEAIAPDVMRMGYHAPPRQAGSKAGGETPFNIEALHGWMAQSALGDPPDANPTEHPDALLMRLIFGAASQAGFNAALTTGGNTTTVAVSAGWTASIIGHAINVPLVGGGRATTWVTDATDGGAGAGTYTVLTLPAACASTGTAYGSNTIYLPHAHTTPANGLTMQWLGADAAAHTRHADALVTGTVTINLDPKTPPSMAGNLIAGAWSLPGSGGAPAPAKYHYPRIPPLMASQGASFTVNGTAYATQSCQLELDIEVEEIGDHNGTEGVGRYNVTHRDARLVVATMRDSLAALSGPGASWNYVRLDSALEAGRMCGLLLAAPVVLEQENMEAAGNLIGVKTTLGLDFSELDAADTGPGNSPLRWYYI